MMAETNTVGDMIELAYGKSLSAENRRSGDVPVYGSNGIVGCHDTAAIDGPGIVVGRKGSVGAVVYADGPFWPIDTTYYVVNKGGHDWRFLFHFLRTLGLEGLNSHSAVPGLNREDVYGIAVTPPDRSNESVIARVLDEIEQAISTENLLIDTSRELKRATMREAFTRGIRGESQKETEIGSIPDSWELIEFGQARRRLQYGTSIRCSAEPSPHPVLRIPNIAQGRVDASDLKYAIVSEKEASRHRLEDGDIIFIRTNGVLERLGCCAVFSGEPEGALFASYLIRAQPDRTILNPYFAAHFYGSQVGTALVAGRATPAADGKYNLNTGIIDSLPLPLPPTLDEQDEIVAILDAIDTKIDLHQRKQALLAELFRVLLHKLMAGEIRVSDLDLSALQTEVSA